jgi:broad specificity phosphatase PhoE
MEVYFVRHGQTDGNLARRHQHVETPLNEKGRSQITEIAPKIAALKPTHFFSSTQLRAVESTRIIVSYCTDPIPITENSFEEWRRPESLVGQRYMGIGTLFFIWRWFVLRTDKEGESYVNFIKRIVDARTRLESLDQDSKVVVVSHAIFINIFLQHLYSDKPMSFFRAAKCIFDILTMPNAQTVHLTYKENKNGVKEWKINK